MSRPAGAPLRVALDGTPFLDRPTGVGVFVNEVTRRLVRRPDIEIGAFGLTLLGFGEVKRRVPLGVHPFSRPMPAPQLRRRWAVADSPVIELWTGPIDVVHGPNFLVPPAHDAAEIVTVHDLTPLRYPEMCTDEVRLYPQYIQRAADRGAWIHTVSEFVAAEVRDAFSIDPERVVAIPNGVASVPPLDPARGRELAGGHPYVLAIGTIEPRKDYPLLLRAFDQLAGEHPDLRLVIAGNRGWGADAFDEALRALSHRDAVVSLGWVEDADRVALMRGAELLAYPSKYEGFGLPPLEAMASGIPVVATRAGAVVEATGDAASLVDVGDEDALAAAIDRVLTDREHRDALVQAGTANLDRFSWDATAEAIASLYHRAAEDHAGPRSRPRGRDASPWAGRIERLEGLAVRALRPTPLLSLHGRPGRQGGDPAHPAIVRIVVLDYNSGPFLRRCVDALRATVLPAGSDLQLEIVVIDNASTDGSAAAIAADLDDVLVLRNTANRGFPANNLALWDLEGVRYVGLVNSDAFVDPHWLTPLIDALEADDQVGAACPRIVLAPQYVDVEITSPTFVPGGGDTRDLGVMILGARTRRSAPDSPTADVWSEVRVAAVDHGREHGPDGRFQWTGPRTVLRVPVDPDDPRPQVLDLRLAAPDGPGRAPVEVRLVSGGTAIVAPVTAHADWVTVGLDGPRHDMINNAGSLVFTDGYGADRGFLEADGATYDEPADVFAFCGGGVLIEPAFLRDVGVLDPRLFLYYEYKDLSWRGQARGWRYRYVPGSRVRHLHAATAGEGSAMSTYFNERNRLLMLTKNAPLAMTTEALTDLGAVLVADVGAVAGRVSSRRRFDSTDRAHLAHVWHRGRAVAGYVRQLPFLARRRRGLRRTQLVPDAELIAQLTPR